VVRIRNDKQPVRHTHYPLPVLARNTNPFLKQKTHTNTKIRARFLHTTKIQK